MDLSQLDLNLLLVFNAVMRQRSATLAGEDLDMSQSAISNALRRLRMHFGDPLFTRTPRGMAPTLMAERLAEPIQEALDNLRQALQSAHEFEPRSSRRVFRLFMSDVGQMMLLPGLAATLQELSPEATLRVVDVDRRSAQQMMVEGTIDIAIGTFTDMQGAFHRQRLLSKSYCVIARRGHPAFQGALTLERFLDSRHAIFHPSANSHDDVEHVIAALFQARGRRRRVVLELAHGLGIEEAVAATDVLMCVPHRLAACLRARGKIELAPLPFEAPVVEVSQFWHHRFHGDPGHRWLRSLVFRTYSAEREKPWIMPGMVAGTLASAAWASNEAAVQAA
ncbi:MAG TPA: LysR family transcriptional regulator [Caldimonas sp.]|nr:LysR family transcriptional regulator [Caldimonas sp.]